MPNIPPVSTGSRCVHQVMSLKAWRMLITHVYSSPSSPGEEDLPFLLNAFLLIPPWLTFLTLAKPRSDSSNKDSFKIGRTERTRVWAWVVRRTPYILTFVQEEGGMKRRSREDVSGSESSLCGYPSSTHVSTPTEWTTPR